MSQTDYSNYDIEVAAIVDAAIREEFQSVRSAALASAIPYVTLNRKLKGGGSFNVSELRRIAVATGRKTVNFFPPEAA